MGSVLSPFNAFLLLQGIETVALRIERHVENARKVAEFLRNDPRVAWVNYAGFPDSPYYPLAQKYLGGHASSLFTFGIKGGMEAGKTFYDALKLITRLVNIGDAKSLACHPASTTHRQMSARAAAQAGVLPETIRLSIGIEHIDDIIEDLDQALARGLRASLASRQRNRPARPTMTLLLDKQRPIPSPALAPAAARSSAASATQRAGESELTIGAHQQHARQRAEGDRAAVHAPVAGRRRPAAHPLALLLAAVGRRAPSAPRSISTRTTPTSPSSTACRSTA